MTAFGIPGGLEIWVVLIVVLLLFGHRIPGMARSLGSGIVEFKKGLRGESEDSAKKSDSSPESLPRPRSEPVVPPASQRGAAARHEGQGANG